MTPPDSKRSMSLSLVRIISDTKFQLFVIAFAVRLLFVLLFPGVNYYGGITHEYIDAASNLLQGHGLTAYVDVAPFNSGNVQMEYLPFIGRPVGYVLYFAFIGLIAGMSPVAFQIGQAIIMGFSAVLVYKLAQVIFSNHPKSEHIAYWSGILAAVWPNQARFEIALLPDAFTTLIMLGFALELTRFFLTKETKYIIYAGLLLAGSIYLRPDLVLFPLFLLPFGLFFMRPKKVILACVILGGLVAVGIGINTVKNYALSGEIVPLNLGSGTTMYEGISQFGDTLGTTYADDRVAHNVLNTKQLFYPHGKQNDARLFQVAVDTIKHHPWFYATVVLRRIPLMFTVRGLYFSDSVNFAKASDDLSQRFPGKYITMFSDRPIETITRFLSPMLGWLLILLAMVGFVRAWHVSRDAHVMILLLLCYFIGTHLMTNVEPRYFYPAIPLLYPYCISTFFRVRSKAIKA
jgi:hypothetical protein